MEKTKKYAGRRVKVPTVLQVDAVECGVASLAMILAYYGRAVSLEELRIQCNVARDGSKANNILKASQKYGLEGKGYKKEAEDLRNMEGPVIIHWNFNHFLILEGIKGNKVYLNDPASGRRIVSYEELSQSFTGIVLCFTLAEDFNSEKYKRSGVKIFKSLYKKNIATLLFLGLTGLLLITPGLIIPMISQFYVDTILSQKQTGFFYMLAVVFALVLLMKLILSISENLLIIRLKTKLAAEISGTFFWKLLNHPVVFFQQRYTGATSNRVRANTNIAKDFSSKLVTAAVDVIMALLYLVLLLKLNYQLTIICAAITSLNVFILILYYNRLKIGSQRVYLERAKLFGVSVNGIHLIETLKTAGKEDEFFSKWAGYQTKYVNTNHKFSNYRGLIEILPHVLSEITEVVIFIMCARGVMKGAMTFGMFIAYEQLMAGFLAPIVRTVAFTANFRELDTNIRRTANIMNFKNPVAELPVEIAETEDVCAQEIGKLQGAVRVENLSFGYNLLDEPFIKKLSFEMSPGMRIAVVGKSGSGKSTVAKLLAGINKPWSGCIYFDDIPDANIPKHIRAASVSSISQEISVFHTTVKKNILMWSSDIPETDMIQAAKDACIHDDIIKLSSGYNSVVEIDGSNFSGGQLQRLEIARALATNPRVLVMDEATSMLDVYTEKKIFDNIHRRGCSSIIITNRLSTIKDADLILVLDNGKIVQSGIHEELISKTYGLYASLVRAGKRG